MIDFTAVKFDEDRAPYVVERGAKGKFERRYLNDAEQQAHKEWDVERVRKLNSQAVAPARGQIRSTQNVDTIGTDRAEARNASMRSGYRLSEGPTGAVGPGPCPRGSDGTVGETGYSPIPLSIESGSDVELPVGQRVARRSVNLMDSIAHLTSALYEFGAINNACVADVRSRILELVDSRENENEDPIGAEDALIEPYYYVKSMAALLHQSYTESRTQAPLKVVGYHAAPIITLTQYLMGLIFPEGDMAARAQSGQLLHRGDEDVGPLAMDILTVYNNIQADISEAGNRLLGEAPEEIGGINVGLGELAKLDTVRAVDEMLEYLVARIDNLTEMLTDQL